ncbi:unnamed protein product [Cyprideis torosa]|uniref:Uncharacterized protein n=1 Tax=Cyprideis torosa TaxID=163714 RepID=A0A7R8ZGD7_9CRUS|nr:unnamed protein product [Cyprideis torosa]CAG0879825.1 unnamed protein product [Cyprideis torosa]
MDLESLQRVHGVQCVKNPFLPPASLLPSLPVKPIPLSETSAGVWSVDAAFSLLSPSGKQPPCISSQGSFDVYTGGRDGGDCWKQCCRTHQAAFHSLGPGLGEGKWNSIGMGDPGWKEEGVVKQTTRKGKARPARPKVTWGEILERKKRGDPDASWAVVVLCGLSSISELLKEDKRQHEDPRFLMEPSPHRDPSGPINLSVSKANGTGLEDHPLLKKAKLVAPIRTGMSRERVTGLSPWEEEAEGKLTSEHIVRCWLLLVAAIQAESVLLSSLSSTSLVTLEPGVQSTRGVLKFTVWNSRHDAFPSVKRGSVSTYEFFLSRNSDPMEAMARGRVRCPQNSFSDACS